MRMENRGLIEPLPRIADRVEKGETHEDAEDERPARAPGRNDVETSDRRDEKEFLVDEMDSNKETGSPRS